MTDDAQLLADRHDLRRLTRGGRYPLWDLPPMPFNTRTTRARWTGEVRRPLKGEWYLSGAVIAAYKAPANLSHDFAIAELVQGRTVSTWVDDPR